MIGVAARTSPVERYLDEVVADRRSIAPPAHFVQDVVAVPLA
jgi:hypothetical protein